MNEYENQSHSKWDCKYHVVFIPKCRRKVLYGELRRYLGEVFHGLARQKECRIEEGHLMLDHVHMMLSIPPKYSVAQVVGYIKGKSAIPVARVFIDKRINKAMLDSSSSAPKSRTRKTSSTGLWPCLRGFFSVRDLSLEESVAEPGFIYAFINSFDLTFFMPSVTLFSTRVQHRSARISSE